MDDLKYCCFENTTSCCALHSRISKSSIIIIQHCHSYPAGYLYPAVHRTAAHWTAAAMLQDSGRMYVLLPIIIKL
jgi:hypothetical protein